MQRFLATLLVVSFSFPLLLPAMLRGTESKLPACCRRDGKHKCGMAAPKAGKLAFGKSPCAQFPGSQSTRAERDDLPLSTLETSVRWAMAADAPTPAGASPRGEFRLRKSPRGPPILL